MQADRIYCGDALTVLKTLPDNSVNCCVTSPQYYALRDYGVDGQIGREGGQDGRRFRRKPVFNFMIRWLCPIFAAIILASSVANAFGWIAM